jgi:hypothetical protein
MNLASISLFLENMPGASEAIKSKAKYQVNAMPEKVLLQANSKIK